MNLDSILAAIDAEISKLEQARALLITGAEAPVKRGPGRPKKQQPVAAAPKKVKKRVFSPEARARIIAGQKRRWSAVKKAAKKSAE